MDTERSPSRSRLIPVVTAIAVIFLIATIVLSAVLVLEKRREDAPPEPVSTPAVATVGTVAPGMPRGPNPEDFLSDPEPLTDELRAVLAPLGLASSELDGLSYRVVVGRHAGANSVAFVNRRRDVLLVVHGGFFTHDDIDSDGPIVAVGEAHFMGDIRSKSWIYIADQAFPRGVVEGREIYLGARADVMQVDRFSTTPAVVPAPPRGTPSAASVLRLEATPEGDAPPEPAAVVGPDERVAGPIEHDGLSIEVWRLEEEGADHEEERVVQSRFELRWRRGADGPEGVESLYRTDAKTASDLERVRLGEWGLAWRRSGVVFELRSPGARSSETGYVLGSGVVLCERPMGIAGRPTPLDDVVRATLAGCGVPAERLDRLGQIVASGAFGFRASIVNEDPGVVLVIAPGFDARERVVSYGPVIVGAGARVTEGIVADDVVWVDEGARIRRELRAPAVFAASERAARAIRRPADEVRIVPAPSGD